MKNNSQDEPQIVRMVIDTNLWISFLIGKKLDCLLELLDNPWFELVSTARLNEEILEVSRRPKLRKYFREENVLLLEEWMNQHFVMVEIDDIPKRRRDPKDDYLLELAVRANAIYLVSGDKDLLDIGQINECRIMTVAQFEAEWK
ncbi:MAG: putative toxin-antitoxin system toxin component, PIN family [bacterium]|nr:putative toxin-antitoxin system toxin component, PIN family [Candidatus Limimorpha equi]